MTELSFYNSTSKEINITLPNSKSLVIRYLIGEYLYLNKIRPITPSETNDVQIVHKALTMIQAASEARKKNRSISNFRENTIEVEDCGAAYRFLLALLSITEGKWFLTGTKRLLKRPIQPLFDALLSIGANIEKESDGWKIIGKTLKADHLSIDCSQSSQLASALLLIAPKLGNPSIEMIPEYPSSYSYITMTKNVVSQILNQKTFQEEGDWSAAAFWYGIQLLKPDFHITLKPLFQDSLQGDAILSDIFAQMGVDSQFHKEDFSVALSLKEFAHFQQLEENKTFEFDLRNHPDLFPVLAAVAIIYPFEMILHGLQNLNYKESARLDVALHTLIQFTEIQIFTKENDEVSMKIYRRKRALPDKIYLPTYNDHRFVMAWSLFAARCEVVIDNSLSVQKSYPHFMNDIQKL